MKKPVERGRFDALRQRWLGNLRQWWLRVRCPTEFLCDNCKNDYRNLCYRRQRPNAIKCPDYEPKS